MILGFDASSYLECLEKGAVYTVHGQTVDPLSYLRDVNGCSLFRVRLWVDPYDEEGHPYHGGGNDLESTVKLCKLALERGYEILLDFHFSDFWADPAKQFLPKAWQGLDYEKLCETLRNYVVSCLKTLQKEGIPLHSIQIGNEITNGFMWPLGKLNHHAEKEEDKGYERFLRLLSIASSSCREVCPEAKLVIHLERSYDAPLYQDYFDHVRDAGIDYDVIGLSYYPYWHHLFDEVFANIDALKARYGKAIWIVETSYAFTGDASYLGQEAGPLVSQALVTRDGLMMPYPFTPQGQADFIHELLRLSKEHGVEAIFYWEPLWLPCPGLEWASVAGQDYINEHRKTDNEWANQCLFDYHGEATPALYEYKLD